MCGRQQRCIEGTTRPLLRSGGFLERFFFFFFTNKKRRKTKTNKSPTTLKLLSSADSGSNIKARVEGLHKVHRTGALARDLGCAARSLLDGPSQVLAAHLVHISAIGTAAHRRILRQVSALGNAGAEGALGYHHSSGTRCGSPRVLAIQLAARSLRLI